MEKIPMTRAGFDQLDRELRDLKAVERPAVIRAIAEAREHGDLSENAEYHAAREKQSFIEGRVKELEGILGLADVIDTSKMFRSFEIPIIFVTSLYPHVLYCVALIVTPPHSFSLD